MLSLSLLFQAGSVFAGIFSKTLSVSHVTHRVLSHQTRVSSLELSWITPSLFLAPAEIRKTVSRSVVPDSLRSRGLQPTRLLCLWGFPGKNTGVGCHFLLQGIFPTQGTKLGFLHWQTDSLLTELPGKPLDPLAKYLISLALINDFAGTLSVL